MKLIASLSIIFIFCFCMCPLFSFVYADVTKKEPKTLAEALKVYSTPFIDNYRVRYNFDNYTKSLASRVAYDSCSIFNDSSLDKIPCTEQDIANIKKLAKYGDNASLNLAAFLIEDKELLKSYFKSAADNGSIEGLIGYGEMIEKNDFMLAKNYYEKAKAMGAVAGYRVMLRFYSNRKMKKDFCLLMHEGYEKFGFEFIVGDLLQTASSKKLENQLKLTLFNQYPKICLDKTSEEIFKEVNLPLSMLYQGYQYVVDKKYKEAKNLFQKIYDESNSVDLKQNAGFCLGAMYYTGTNIKQNREYGVKLIKDALNEGYIISFPENISEIQKIPSSYRLLKHSGTCEYILIRNSK